jgi:hypothetical protein
MTLSSKQKAYQTRRLILQPSGKKFVRSRLERKPVPEWPYIYDCPECNRTIFTLKRLAIVLPANVLPCNRPYHGEPCKGALVLRKRDTLPIRRKP